MKDEELATIKPPALGQTMPFLSYVRRETATACKLLQSPSKVMCGR